MKLLLSEIRLNEWKEGYKEGAWRGVFLGMCLMQLGYGVIWLLTK